MSWDAVDDQRAKQLLAQLTREVGKGHVLYGRIGNLDVVAAASENDDIAVRDRVKDEMLGVHPTWSRKPERDPRWPSVWELDETDLNNLPGASTRRDPDSLLEARN